MPQQKTPLSRAALAPQGPGAQTNAAVSAVQNMMNEQQQSGTRLMQHVTQLQAAGAMDAQAQRQQVASGVGDIANMISGGLQNMQQERKQREQMVEKVQLQEDLTEFENKLNVETQQEAQRVGLLLKQQEDSTMQEIKRWQSKGEEMQVTHNGVVDTFHNLIKNGTFRNMPNGYKMMNDIYESIKMSEAYVEDHTSPAYVSHAVALMQQAQRDVAAGRDPVDLAALYDRPDSLPYGDVQETGKELNTLDGKTRFRMMLRGGYPEEGLFALQEDDPRRPHINMVTPDVMAQLLVDNATYTSLISDEAKKKFEDYRLRQLDEADRRMAPMAESYEKVANMMDSRAPEAIRRGIQTFMASNPSDINATPQQLFDHVMHQMFPEGGDKISQFAKQVRDRTASLDTPLEFGAAMSLEAAAWAVEDNIVKTLAFTQAGDSGKQGQTMLSTMADQMRSQMTPQQAMQTFGPNSIDRNGQFTPEGLVQAQAKIQAQLEATKSLAGEVRMAANETGALAGFRKEFGKNSRMRDVYLYKYFTGRGDERQKAKDMLYGEIKNQTDSMTLDELQNLSVGATNDVDKMRNIIDSTIEFVQAVGPDQLPKVAALLSGGQIDLTDGNTQKLNAALQSVTERSDYMKLVSQNLADSRDLEKVAKDARANGTPLQPQQMAQLREQKRQGRVSMADKMRAIESGRAGLGDFLGAGMGVLKKNFTKGLGVIGESFQQTGEDISQGVGGGLTQTFNRGDE